MSLARVRRGEGLDNTKAFLRDSFAAIFTLFPVAHVLSFLGLIDPLTEEKSYCVGDLLMKVLILGNLAVENVFETREESLRRIAEERKQFMLEQLQKAVESGDKFISMVSHELRTPIHGIMGLAEALLITDTSDPQCSMGDTDECGVRFESHDPKHSTFAQRATKDELNSIRAIVKSGRGLLDLVNNLLAHASLKAGGPSLTVIKRPFNIAEVVLRCVEMKHPYLAPGVSILVGPSPTFLPS